ncbi:MAG: gliding motility lipoprotein GldH [Chitinophagaceae bacterium]|nr:MAG: gliding motility lipoprotein GldH [Chitinophagaceae bacterium]
MNWRRQKNKCSTFYSFTLPSLYFMTRTKYSITSNTIVFLVSLIAFAGCRQINVFEKNTPIPDYKWSKNFAAKGNFEIQDTLSSYNIYLVLRHTDAYEKNNIWLNVGLQTPGDSLFFQKVDLSLGSDATGWEGTGMNDIWEVRKPLALNKRFKKKGEYQFMVYHIMREDPLPYVMSAGMRIEKAP